MEADLLRVRSEHRTVRTQAHTQKEEEEEIISFGEPSRIRGHKERVFHLEPSPVDPDVLLSGGEDTTCRLWRLGQNEHKCEKVFRGHKEEILICGFSPSGDLVASGGNDNIICVWDNGRLKHAVEHADFSMRPVKRMRPEDEHHACCADPNSLEVQEQEEFEQAEEGGLVARLTLKDQPYGCSFLSDTELVTACGGVMTLWDMAVGEASGEVCVGNDVPASSGATFVYGGERNPNAEVWIFETSLAPNTGIMATACSDGLVRLYDARFRSPKPICRVQNNAATSCAATTCHFEADGTELGSAWGNGMMSSFDLRAGIQRMCVTAHQSIVYKCRWWQHMHQSSPLLVSASKDRSCKLWDVATGKQHGETLAHSDDVLTLAVSPLKPYLAIAGGSGGYIQNSQIHIYRKAEQALAQFCVPCGL